jgi:murein DD-endopeptidase MepM/ murein hydrolase activator NlpD
MSLHRALLVLLLCALAIKTSAAQPLRGRGLPEALLIPSQIAPGETAVLRLLAPVKLDDPQLSIFNRSLPLFRVGSGRHFIYMIHLGIDLKDPVGRHNLTVSWGDRGDVAHKMAISFEVLPKEYPAETVTLPKTARPLLKGRTLREESRRLAELLYRFDQRRYWQGPFLRPVNSPISSPFGLRRIYKPGRLAAWRHKGVDFRAPYGTPVLSPNHGMVRFCEPMKAHGNTLVIDHGQGVFSIFLHLKAFTVRKGQRVSKGQVVGQVGSSGIATGPHLHWGLSVGGVRVNPITWTRRDMGG